MPASVLDFSHRPETLITRLGATDKEVQLKALRELKNQIIGNRTKKLCYVDLGAVPAVVSALSAASASAFQGDDSDIVACLLVESAAALGSFACGVDAGVKAVIHSGALPHFLHLFSHPNAKVVDTCGRSLRMVYRSKFAPKYDFFSQKDREFLLSLLNSENGNFICLGLSIINHSCENSTEQKVLCDAGIVKKLISLIEASIYQRDATLEALTKILKDNDDVISEFVKHKTGRSIYVVSELTKDRSPRTRLLACMCLIVITNASSYYLLDVGVRTKLILALLELLDDPSHVGDEASFIFSSLIAEKEDMMKLAFEANAVDTLVNHLQVGPLQPKRIQGILLALGDLCSKLECCRSRLLTLEVMNFIITAISHTVAEVRIAACICLRNASRSIKVCKLVFSSDANLKPLVQLLHVPCPSVLVAAALGAISNILVHVTTRNSNFVQCGGVQLLVMLSNSIESTTRLNALCALKNLMFLADNGLKNIIFSKLTVSYLTSLVCDPDLLIQEQALAIIRNLVEGGFDSIEYVFVEDSMLLHAVGRQLQSCSRPEVGIQGMYLLANVASGSESHRDAVTKEILESAGVLIFLQSNDSRLRTAATWAILNVTFPGCPGAMYRFTMLRDAGIIAQIRTMVQDPCLDVKLRAEMVIGQSLKLGYNC